MKSRSPIRKTTVSRQAPRLVPALIVAAACCLASCKSAEVTSERDFATEGLSKPSAIYVSDFELSAQDVHHEEGVLSGRPGPVGRVGERLSGASTDPSARARELVDLMSTSLIKDLSSAGLRAIRLHPGEALPAEGWLVRGIFTEVQEGNRVRRSLIGFGEGQTDVQVIARVDDLSHGPPERFYELDTDATSRKGPGAGATLAFTPYGAAARFVMAGKDLEKNIQQTASQIAERIARRAQALK